MPEDTPTYDYGPPMDKLLVYGDCREYRGWPNYLELGFAEEHIPELIRMALDEDLHWADGDSDEVWAPIHAWRTLGQLKAQEAADALIELLRRDEDDGWDDWLDELPQVYAMIGPSSIPVLQRFLEDETHNPWRRTATADALQRIAGQHPEVRDECVAILANQLAKYRRNTDFFNGLVISHLVDLKAVEAADLMERAFAENTVDTMIMGDWNMVRGELGLAPDESTTPQPPQREAAPKPSRRKAKSKRKQAQKSRRKNRRR